MSTDHKWLFSLLHYSFSHYYVEIKKSNVIIDGFFFFFFDMPVKNEEEAYENIVDMSNNHDYPTGNLLDFAYFKKHYKLMATNLSKQTELKDTHYINFIGKLENQIMEQQFFPL